MSEESTNSGPVGTHEKVPFFVPKIFAKHSYEESSTYIQVDQLQTQTSKYWYERYGEWSLLLILVWYIPLKINQYVMRARCPSNEKVNYFEAFSYQLGLDTIFVTYQRFVRVIYFHMKNTLRRFHTISGHF